MKINSKKNKLNFQCISSFSYKNKGYLREFPGGLVVRTPRFHWEGLIQGLVGKLRSHKPRWYSQREKQKRGQGGMSRQYLDKNFFFWVKNFTWWVCVEVIKSRASLVAQLVKNMPAMQETWVRSLGWEDPLEKGKATHSSILACRISWTLQSIGSQRGGHDWVTFTIKNYS